MKKLGIAAALAALVAVAAPGLAEAGNDVRATGKCSGSSTTKIKAKARDGRLEVEFEVDQNKNGVPWKVKIKDNGDLQFRQIDSGKGNCVKDRKVVLYRKKNGSKKKLGGDHTNNKGKFDIEIGKAKLKSGTYFAEVNQAKIGDNDGKKNTCLSTKSPKLKLSN